MGSIKSLIRLLLTGIALSIATSSTGENTMASTSDIAAYLQKQGPQLYFGNQSIFDNLELVISDESFQGIAIAAPGQINTNEQHELPVILVSQQTVLRGWEVSEQNNLQLAITDLNSGRVLMRRILEDLKDMEQSDSMAVVRPPKPTGSAATGIETKIQKVDALSYFELPWQSGRLSITAICFDQISNTAQVDLFGQQPAQLETMPVSPHPAETRPALPSFLPPEQSPPISQEGLVFTVDTSLITNKQLVIHGGFSKTLAQNEHLPTPGTIIDNETHQHAVAVVPITIAVLGLDWRVPRLRILGVPVYAPGLSPNRTSARGYFSVALATNESPLASGPIVIYAFMQGRIYGPVKIQVP